MFKSNELSVERLVDRIGSAHQQFPVAMLLCSLAVHCGVAAELWPAFTPNRLAEAHEPKSFSVELVAAKAPLHDLEEQHHAQPPQQKMSPQPPAVEERPVAKRQGPVPREYKSTASRKPQSVVRSDALHTGLPGPNIANSPEGAIASSKAVAMMPSGVRKAYGAMIWEQIARHKPASVHLQGTAYVRFTVTASGEIETISIIQSSGSMDLDTLALRTIRRAAPFDPPPASLTSRDLVFEVPFNFL